MKPDYNRQLAIGRLIAVHASAFKIYRRISTCFQRIPLTEVCLTLIPQNRSLIPVSPRPFLCQRLPCPSTCCVRLFVEPPCLQSHSQRPNPSEVLSATTRPLRPLLPSPISLLSRAWVPLYSQLVVTMCIPLTPTPLRALRAP